MSCSGVQRLEVSESREFVLFAVSSSSGVNGSSGGVTRRSEVIKAAPIHDDALEVVLDPPNDDETEDVEFEAALCRGDGAATIH